MTDETPAVIGLLARRPARVLLHATLLDLAARGWFRLRFPDAQTEPVMFVLAQEPPAETLTPCEQRVLAHVASRAGARHGELPAQALCDGFDEGEDKFLREFREEVVAHARQQGLSRQLLRNGWLGLLLVAVLAGAGAVALTHRRHGGVLLTPLCWGSGTRQRPPR